MLVYTDLTHQRVDAAKAHIQSLNPLVVVETVSSKEALHANGLENLIHSVDLVCVTDASRDFLVNTGVYHIRVWSERPSDYRKHRLPTLE